MVFTYTCEIYLYMWYLPVHMEFTYTYGIYLYILNLPINMEFTYKKLADLGLHYFLLGLKLMQTVCLLVQIWYIMLSECSSCIMCRL